MPTESPGEVIQLLRAWSDGEDGALERLTPLVEAEVHRQAKVWLVRGHDGDVQ